MSSEKKNSTSKRIKKNKKEPKLTAVERRRLERESQKGEETRFSAFETYTESSKSKTQSHKERLSNFDVSKNDTTYNDDYFERNYGSYARSSKSDSRSTLNSRQSSSSSSTDKPGKSKELTKKQRKLRTLISYGGVFLVIITLAVFISVTVMFKTTEIIVEGENIPYSDEEIIEVSGLKYTENIFTAKRKAAVKSLTEKLPYIEDASVGYRIPGTQIITLTVAVPSYQVAVGDTFAIISANGRVLENVAAQRTGIPLLKGLKLTDSNEGQYISFEKETTRQILNEVINNVNENNVPNIYGIDISNSANIKLNYDNRITIFLGMPEDVGYKLRTAMSIINNQLAATDKGELDVSLACSDRKSSYFTPVQNNTVSIEDNTVSMGGGSSGDTVIKSAEEYRSDAAGNNNDDTYEDYDYLDDIMTYEDYEDFEEENETGNIQSQYGSN